MLLRSGCVLSDNYCYGLITSYGDDKTLIEVSQDKGEEFKAISSSTTWEEPLHTEIYHVTSNTIIRFTITNVQGPAGLLSTMRLYSSNETKHYAEFYTDQGLTKEMGFVSEQPVDTIYKYGTGPWNAYVNPSTNYKNNPGPPINLSAYWASWTGTTAPNIFTFDFGHQAKVLNQLQCQVDIIQTTSIPVYKHNIPIGWIIAFVVSWIGMMVVGIFYWRKKRRLDRALLAFQQMRHYGTNDQQGQRIDTP